MQPLNSFFTDAQLESLESRHGFTPALQKLTKLCDESSSRLSWSLSVSNDYRYAKMIQISIHPDNYDHEEHKYYDNVHWRNMRFRMAYNLSERDSWDPVEILVTDNFGYNQYKYEQTFTQAVKKLLALYEKFDHNIVSLLTVPPQTMKWFLRKNPKVPIDRQVNRVISKCLDYRMEQA